MGAARTGQYRAPGRDKVEGNLGLRRKLPSKTEKTVVVVVVVVIVVVVVVVRITMKNTLSA